MILVTGATGFVGQALVRRLSDEGREVACLIRPSSMERRIPGANFLAITGTVEEPEALGEAMCGVKTVIHLVAVRQEWEDESFQTVNVQGTRNVIGAAVAAGVRQIIYLSIIGAERSLAFPLLSSKGEAENLVRKSGLDHTILRSSLIFGPGDSFTAILAMLLKVIPLFFPVPGDGHTRFQPIHVEDVARCLAGCIANPHTLGQTVAVGGPRHYSYNEILGIVMRVLGVRRKLIHLRMPTMRKLVGFTERWFPNPPVSVAQLDLFSIDNTADLLSVPRNFGFEPHRFADSLDYLKGKGWRREFFRYINRVDA